MMKILKKKWMIKGDFFFVDIGYDYYIVRFINMEDYKFVLI